QLPQAAPQGTTRRCPGGEVGLAGPGRPGVTAPIDRYGCLSIWFLVSHRHGPAGAAVIPGQIRDQVGLHIEAEVAAVEDMHLGAWHVPAAGAVAGRPSSPTARSRASAGTPPGRSCRGEERNSSSSTSPTWANSTSNDRTAMRRS